MTVTSARKNIYDVVEKAAKPGSAVTLTLEGEPKVVIMSFEEYESWQETMEIMADPFLVEGIEKGVKEMKAGKVVDFETVKKRLAA